MKKLFLGIFIASFIVACTKEDGPATVDVEKSSPEKFGVYDDARGLGAGGSMGPNGQNGNGNQLEPGQITSAEWNDLDNWNFWSGLINGQDYAKMPDYWSFDLSGRISVNITQSGLPAKNQVVELLSSEGKSLWKAKTDNHGKAELWVSKKISPNGLKLKAGSKIVQNVLLFEKGVNNISLNTPLKDQSNKTQIALMVDATGSMSDELEYLKVELVDVIDRVKSANPDAVIETGSVFYRDEGDDYVTKKSDFTANTDKTIQFIREQSANGGGDFPEAVHTALNHSLKNLQWADNASTRILFIVLDAPPHYEEQIVSEIHTLTKFAAESGIKLIPIVASGIDKETEFLMRYLSMISNGTYIFITNDSGIGNDHLAASVGKYEVELLNDLMVRLVNKYME